MPDIYIKMREAAPNMLEGLMTALETRAADLFNVMERWSSHE
jgi:hypothetical protein